jgi:hypothetical protein
MPYRTVCLFDFIMALRCTGLPYTVLPPYIYGRPPYTVRRAALVAPNFCIRFPLIHDVDDFDITRASSLVLTIFVYTRLPLPLIIYCHRVYPRVP